MLTLIYLVLGLVLAAAFLRATTVTAADRTRLLGSALVIAAFVYVAFAMAAMESARLLIEMLGVMLFLVFAVLGVRRSLYWLAAGWGLHVFWDLGFHLLSPSDFAPLWYPTMCISFDLVLAWYVIQIARVPIPQAEAGLA